MTPQNNLELKGNLTAFPLAELLVEINHAQFDGSLRFSHADRKIIVYFNQGKVVYAVSNARASRLFDILLREKKIDQKILSEVPNFTSDFELGKALVEKNLFSEQAINATFAYQIEDILRESLHWTSGEWFFNPLARIKEGINFEVNVSKLLIEFGRKLDAEAVFSRFSSFQENFAANPVSDLNLALKPQEAFVLSRFANTQLTIESLKNLSGLSESVTFQILYTLWLGGFLIRKHWNSAFGEQYISHIKSAHIQLKKKAEPKPATVIKPVIEPQKPIVEEITENEEPQPEFSEEKITLEDYLKQIENSTNHYETLGVELKTDVREIKKIYFGFAKQFHPDLFHRNSTPEIHQKVQNAFTKLASAYETLRDKDLREIYDFKIRKELAEMAERQASGKSDETILEEDREAMASENFQQGYNLLMEEYHAEAEPFLARAVHLAPDNARYHAFYGKSLSFDQKQRHKAENEIQTAIKLDPQNELYRIISAEFFIHYGLMKRAEGELKRLLAIAPNNREAQVLLDSLQNK